MQHLGARLSELDPVNKAVFRIDQFPGSPIFSIRTPSPRHLATFCQKNGFVVRAIMPPTVPAGIERVRVCLHAGNTTGEIDAFVHVLRRWLDNVKTDAARL